jgi:hypothetical protein
LLGPSCVVPNKFQARVVSSKKTMEKHITEQIVTQYFRELQLADFTSLD